MQEGQVLGIACGLGILCMGLGPDKDTTYIVIGGLTILYIVFNISPPQKFAIT